MSTPEKHGGGSSTDDVDRPIMIRLTIDVAVYESAKMRAMAAKRKESWGYGPDEELSFEEQVYQVLVNNGDFDPVDVGCEIIDHRTEPWVDAETPPQATSAASRSQR